MKLVGGSRFYPKMRLKTLPCRILAVGLCPAERGATEEGTWSNGKLCDSRLEKLGWKKDQARKVEDWSTVSHRI